MHISYLDFRFGFGGVFTMGLAYEVLKKVSVLLVFLNYWSHS